jgi:hypothetical protein
VSTAVEYTAVFPIEGKGNRTEVTEETGDTVANKLGCGCEPKNGKSRTEDTEVTEGLRSEPGGAA